LYSSVVCATVTRYLTVAILPRRPIKTTLQNELGRKYDTFRVILVTTSDG